MRRHLQMGPSFLSHLLSQGRAHVVTGDRRGRGPVGGLMDSLRLAAVPRMPVLGDEKHEGTSVLPLPLTSYLEHVNLFSSEIVSSFVK